MHAYIHTYIHIEGLGFSAQCHATLSPSGEGGGEEGAGGRGAGGEGEGGGGGGAAAAAGSLLMEGGRALGLCCKLMGQG